MDRSNILECISRKHGCAAAEITIENVQERDESRGNQLVRHILVTYRIKGKRAQHAFQELVDLVEKAKTDHPAEFSLAWLEGRDVRWEAIGLPDCVIANPTTILATAGGLKAHEGVLLRRGQHSHSLYQHCEQPWDVLKARVLSGRTDYATTFEFREVMEVVVGSTLDTDRPSILKWVRSGGSLRYQLLQRRVIRSAGYGCFRTSKSSKPQEVHEILAVSIVLERTPAKNGLPFTIVTAYPDARPRLKPPK